MAAYTRGRRLPRTIGRYRVGGSVLARPSFSTSRSAAQRSLDQWFFGTRYLLAVKGSAEVAFSTRLLRENYTGQCLRVRRSSDNAEQDIGFLNDKLDTASLTSFVGANDGFVVTWYDQSGNARNATQATAAKQPYIVVGGATRPWGSGGDVALYNPAENRFLAYTMPTLSAAYSTMLAGRAVTVNVAVAWLLGPVNYWVLSDGTSAKYFDGAGVPVTPHNTTARTLIASYTDGYKKLRSPAGTVSTSDAFSAWFPGNGLIGTYTDGYANPQDAEFHTCVVWATIADDLDELYAVPEAWLLATGGGGAVELSGSVAATVSLSGSAAVDRALSGSTAYTSGLTGALAVARALAGQIDASTSLSAALAVARALSGTVDSTTSLSATAEVARALAGTIAAQVNLSGSVSSDKPLSGSIAAEVALSALLGKLVALTGQVDYETTLSGQLSRVAGLSGQVDTTVSLAGAAAVARALSGSVSAEVSLSGALASSKSLAGSVAVEIGTTGQIAVVRPLVGQVDSTFSLSGQIGSTKPLTGGVAVTVGTTGELAVARALAGQVDLVVSFSGSLTGGGQVELSGSVALAVTTSGLLIASRALAGQVDAVVQLSAALGSDKPLAGSVDMSYGLTGSVSVDRALAGNVSYTTTTSGLLVVQRALTGSISTEINLAATLAAARPLVGQVSTTFTLVGDLLVDAVFQPLAAALLATLHKNGLSVSRVLNDLVSDDATERLIATTVLQSMMAQLHDDELEAL